ncbi:hypothetical protein CEP53_009925 [Fusarium sp. AF-6]|nr:hypothetical protein CEP53_009925 [Fusarium sp. AF-6]
MSGIAKTFQEAKNDSYLGLSPQEMIHVDLRWTTNASDGAKVRRSDSYAPTWSWASAIGGYKRLSMLHEKYSRFPEPHVTFIGEQFMTGPLGDATGFPPLRRARYCVHAVLLRIDDSVEQSRGGHIRGKNIQDLPSTQRVWC